MSATRRGRGVAAAVGLLGALASPAGASAATDGDAGGGVMVSSDGVNWGSELSTPLFDPTVQWVPGDVLSGSFYVRNDGATQAALRIEGRDAVTGELTDGRAVALFARADGGRWQRLRMGAMSEQLNVAGLPVGTVSRVQVRAVFEPAADNRSQDRKAELTFVVSLADASAAAPGDGTPTSAGHLPGTGAPEITVPLLAGAGLVGAGIALVGRRRVRHG